MYDLLRTSSAMRLFTTPDHSATRLLLEMTAEDVTAQTQLTVADVQELAGALCQWLADNGHQLPELDLPDLDLEDELLDLEPAASAPTNLPPASVGQLVVEDTDTGLRIRRADPWVICSGDLLARIMRQPRPEWVTVDGLRMTFRDSLGGQVRYLVRPDVDCPAGSVVLQRLWGNGEDVVDLLARRPEHTR